MKIKQVCEQTGLTDRAIRYYIEEGLAAPAYTENYMGRRAYDFADVDVERLNDVATLRKFGFTVGEIRRVLELPEESGAVIAGVLARKQETVGQEQADIAVLLMLENRSYTLPELARALSEPVKEKPAPVENAPLAWDAVLMRLAASVVMLIVAALPVYFIVSGILFSMRMWHYATFDMRNVVSILIALVPTLVMAILWYRKRHGKGRTWTRCLAVVLCVLYLPVSLLFGFGGSMGYSVTTDINDYRRFDADCLANRDTFLQDMLPLWPGNREGAVYLYRNLPALDYTYDIYAEWSLPQDKFDAEVARMMKLFTERAPEHIVMERGGYTLLMSLESYDDIAPFTPVTDNYEIYIFAYDAENCRVRYINCVSLENGADQPYYLELDWDE